MDFSIVLASRERPQLLTNLIQSVQRTTAFLDKVEVLIGIDDDDFEYIPLAERLQAEYPFARFYTRQRSPMLNRDYLNWLTLEYSSGKYIIVCNDDTEFKTQDWDFIINRKLDEYLEDKADGIVYGYISDNLINRHGMQYCCFPLVSRAGVDVLGFAIPPEFPAWNADIGLWRIYHHTDRVCDLSEVLIDHISYHAGKRSEDNINHHVRQLSGVYIHSPTDHYIAQINAAKRSRPLSIIKQVRNNYNAVATHQNQIAYDPRLDTIWANNMHDIHALVNSCSTAEQLIDRIDQTFMYSINFPPENARVNGKDSGVWQSEQDVPRIREKQIDWLLKHQKKEGLNVFDLPFEESEFVHSRNKVVREGRTYTGNFLRTVSIAHRLFSHVDKSEIHNIVELGGGAGHQARTFMKYLPDCKYTIIDLPETLIFSFAHISLCFPDKKILYVKSEQDAAVADEYDVVFVPVVFSPLFHGKSYDLFVNTASMGEMRNDVIHGWMDFIQNKINLKYLFTLNRYLNVVNSDLAVFRTHENECSVTYDHKWNIINWELEPVYCRCPFIDTLHSRYVEIIASRPAEVSVENLIEKSNFYLNEVMDEDWYRLKGMYGDGLMQARSNVLVNDMTMSGTLFKLWESIRLDQNATNVGIMIEYLKRINVSHRFEELFYYDALLSRLII